MTTIYVILGILAAAAVVMAAAFKVGQKSGEDSLEIKGLKAENMLRKRYEDIDNAADTEHPFNEL